MLPAAALTAALMRDKDVAGCARDSAKTSQTYVATAFDLRNLTLRGGERMTVAVAKDPCLALGQSTRIMIFEHTADGYRRVLNEVTLPDLDQVETDGTVMLPTHESVGVIFEGVYVWNGAAYAFSASRSHIYDVALSERKPYQVPVRFAPGTSTATLSGYVALNFGDEYVFEARAGQNLTIALAKYSGRRPSISLYYGSDISILADIPGATGGWSGTLPRTGSYHLFVDGTDESDGTRRTTYAINLTIH